MSSGSELMLHPWCEYLKNWKTTREQWKYEKNLEKKILKNFTNESIFPANYFKIILEYLITVESIKRRKKTFEFCFRELKNEENKVKKEIFAFNKLDNPAFDKENIADEELEAYLSKSSAFQRAKIVAEMLTAIDQSSDVKMFTEKELKDKSQQKKIEQMEKETKEKAKAKKEAFLKAKLERQNKPKQEEEEQDEKPVEEEDQRMKIDEDELAENSRQRVVVPPTEVPQKAKKFSFNSQNQTDKKRKFGDFDNKNKTSNFNNRSPQNFNNRNPQNYQQPQQQQFNNPLNSNNNQLEPAAKKQKQDTNSFAAAPAPAGNPPPSSSYASFLARFGNPKK